MLTPFYNLLKQHPCIWLCFSRTSCLSVCLSVGALTFLVLEPELLLGLLAGEVDAAAELGAVQRLRHVVAAILLEEGQQLLTCAGRRQRLQHLGKA